MIRSVVISLKGPLKPIQTRPATKEAFLFRREEVAEEEWKGPGEGGCTGEGEAVFRGVVGAEVSCSAAVAALPSVENAGLLKPGQTPVVAAEILWNQLQLGNARSQTVVACPFG